MRKIFFLLILITSPMMAQTVVEGHRVGTYNIRTNNTQDDKGDFAWDKRKPMVMQVIRDSANFDVVALQEVTSSQRSYIQNQLKSVYSFVEHEKNCNNQLLYRTSKYNCLDKGAFYLAPDITKSGHWWDAEFERTVVWAKLQDKTSKEIFYFAATHLDLHPISIREGARTATEQMMKICGDYACILTGDMNCELVQRDPHLHYSTKFGNARSMTKTAPQGPYNTYVGTRRPDAPDGKLIDFIYVRGVEVESYEVCTAQCGLSVLPSDHMPVVCEITLLPYNRKRTHVVNSVAELREQASKIPPGEIIYLKKGAYDIGSEPLNIASSCIIQGNENAYLTGACQLINLSDLVSLELRELTIRDATCPQGGYGSIAHGTGRYIRLINCTIDSCTTEGIGLFYAEDCCLDVDHSVFTNNKIPNAEGCFYTLGRDVLPSSITNSTFKDNYALRAPALYHASAATAYLYGNSFIGNTASEKGAVVFSNNLNTTDVRLVNNSFIGNRISEEEGMTSSSIGGSAIWQEMSNNGCMTLVGNTIVGNYTACWQSEGVSSTDFYSGAVYSYSGQLKVYYNIIAGNYSSLTGRGDLMMEDVSLVKSCLKNIFSSEDNMNYPLGMTDIVSADYTTACNEMITLFGGSVENGAYLPPIQTYGDNRDVWALSPLNTRYAGQNINILETEDLQASSVGSDIMNVGSLTGALIVDQIGTVRNTLSVPGSMEVGATPHVGIEEVKDGRSSVQTKYMIDNRVIIKRNGQCYDVLGNRM